MLTTTLSKNNGTISATMKLASENTLNLDKGKMLLSSKGLTQERSLLKTVWEKEKKLVTSNFAFFNDAFYSVKDRNHHLSYNSFVVCKCF